MLRAVAGDNVAGDQRALDVVVIPSSPEDDPMKWTSASSQVSWLHQLANEVHKSTQIWAFTYSQFKGVRGRRWTANYETYIDEAEKLLEALNTLPPSGVNEAGSIIRPPILFICHSMGGWVIKRAIVTANQSQLTNLFEAIKGVVFISSPHVRGEDFKSRGRQLLQQIADAGNVSLMTWSTRVEMYMAFVSVLTFSMNLMRAAEEDERAFLYLCMTCEHFTKCRPPMRSPVLSIYEGAGVDIVFDGPIFSFPRKKTCIPLVGEQNGSIKGKIGAKNIRFEGRNHYNSICLEREDVPYKEIMALIS